MYRCNLESSLFSNFIICKAFIVQIVRESRKNLPSSLQASREANREARVREEQKERKMKEMLHSEKIQKLSSILEETVNWTPLTGLKTVLYSWDYNCGRSRVQRIFFWYFNSNFLKNAKNV